MLNEIKVTITHNHFSKATDYMDNCPLEVVLREIFPDQDRIEVGGSEIIIGGNNRYLIPEEWGRHDSPKYTPWEIEQTINKSKLSSEGIPSIELNLTKK